MDITTTNSVDGLATKRTIGLVFGTSARTRGIYGHLKAMAENVIGGRATAYVDNMEKARKDALDDLAKNAAKMGANAVVAVDLDITDVMDGYILVLATGTAVVVE